MATGSAYFRHDAGDRRVPVCLPAFWFSPAHALVAPRGLAGELQSIVGIDTLNGFEQSLQFHVQNNNIIVPNLIVKDYPLLLRLEQIQ
jgi:hypothetical protein